MATKIIYSVGNFQFQNKELADWADNYVTKVVENTPSLDTSSLEDEVLVENSILCGLLYAHGFSTYSDVDEAFGKCRRAAEGPSANDEERPLW